MSWSGNGVFSSLDVLAMGEYERRVMFGPIKPKVFFERTWLFFKRKRRCAKCGHDHLRRFETSSMFKLYAYYFCDECEHVDMEVEGEY